MKEMRVVLLKWLKNWPKNFIKRKYKLYHSILTDKESMEAYKEKWNDKFSGLRRVYEDTYKYLGTKFFAFLYVYFPSLLKMEIEEEEEEEVVLEEEEDEVVLEEKKTN